MLDESNCYQNLREFEPPWELRRIKWDCEIIEDGRNVYTDASERNYRIGCAFMIYENDMLIFKRTFRLGNAKVFDGEAFAIWKTIEFGIEHQINSIHVYSDAKSVLMTISGGRSVNEIIKNIRKRILDEEMEVKLHWIKAHSGNVKNEEDMLAKTALESEVIDWDVKFDRRQITAILTNDSLKKWRCRWNELELGRRVFELYPSVSLNRLRGDFYLNQIITGHGTLGPYQQFFGRNALCFCGIGDASVEHVVKSYGVYNNIRQECFPGDFMTKKLSELLMDEGAVRGMRKII